MFNSTDKNCFKKHDENWLFSPPLHSGKFLQNGTSLCLFGRAKSSDLIERRCSIKDCDFQGYILIYKIKEAG